MERRSKMRRLVRMSRSLSERFARGPDSEVFLLPPRWLCGDQSAFPGGTTVVALCRASQAEQYCEHK